MNIVPIGTKVWLERIDAPDTTPSGLVIPEDKHGTVAARVLAVGPGTGPRPDGQMTPVPLHVGDVAVLTWTDWLIGQKVAERDDTQCVIDADRIMGSIDP